MRDHSVSGVRTNDLAGCHIAILTNARIGDQRSTSSMIGYGELLLDGARKTGARVSEWRCMSLTAKLPLRGRWMKLALQIDRFILTPFSLIGRRADLVHVADHGNSIYLPFLRAGKTVVTVHDLIPFLARDGLLRGFRPSVFGLLLMQFTLFCLERVGVLIAPSRSTAQDMMTYLPLKGAETHIIPNAVFLPMERVSVAAASDFRSRHDLQADTKVILHLGRSFYKNRGFVLEIFAHVRRTVPEACLLLVGAIEPRLETQAAELGVTDGMRVIDQLPREEIATLYTSSNVLLFPSLYEGFGYPVIEAGLCGTPVVCSDGGSLAELAQKAKVLPLSAGAANFAKAVITAMNAPRQLVAPICTTEDWFKRHAVLYGQLLGSRNGTE